MTEGNFHQLVALLHCRGLHKVRPVPRPILPGNLRNPYVPLSYLPQSCCLPTHPPPSVHPSSPTARSALTPPSLSPSLPDACCDHIPSMAPTVPKTAQIGPLARGQRWERQRINTQNC